MTRIVLVRHGQSVANVEKFFAGHYDSPLTALGFQQAALTARYIASHYKVDMVYASDLQRAYATGKAIADCFCLGVVKESSFREINAGLWEKMPYEQLPERLPDSYSVWLNNIGKVTCDGGESVAQLQKRVVDAVFSVAEKHPDSTVVIATHATPIRAVQCFCEGKSLDEMKDVPWVSNASVTELVYEDNQLRLEQVSYDLHLGQLKSVLPDKC